jgi:hypothetical protein
MNANDPRLTAHALGEADSESAEFISQDPALEAEAEEIRQLAAALRTEFEREPAHPLRPEQHDAIFAASVVVDDTRWWQQGWALSYAAAAAVVLAFGTAIYFQSEHLNSLQSAGGTASQSEPGRIQVHLMNDPDRPEAPTVISLSPENVAAQPTYQRPQLETVPVNAADVTLPPTSIQRPPTLVTTNPAPEVTVDPSTVPMVGTLPKLRKPAPLQNRAAARPPATPEKR